LLFNDLFVVIVDFGELHFVLCNHFFVISGDAFNSFFFGFKLLLKAVNRFPGDVVTLSQKGALSGC
jgi:hypothetical protein